MFTTLRKNLQQTNNTFTLKLYYESFISFDPELTLNLSANFLQLKAFPIQKFQRRNLINILVIFFKKGNYNIFV